MKASFVAYDFREVHKKSELKIVKLDMSDAAQNSQYSKSGRLKV
jgi:hypothetical protein